MGYLTSAGKASKRKALGSTAVHELKWLISQPSCATVTGASKLPVHRSRTVGADQKLSGG